MATIAAVRRRKTTIENPVAVVLSIPKRVSPTTQANWYDPTLAGALGSELPTLTWGILFGLQILVPNGGGAAFGIDTLGGKLFAVTVQAPWLLPYEAQLHWMVPAALLFMLPFFGIVSVYTERPVFRWIAKVEKDVARSWSWRANLTTYGIMIASVAVWLVVAIVVGA